MGFIMVVLKREGIGCIYSSNIAGDQSEALNPLEEHTKFPIPFKKNLSFPAVPIRMENFTNLDVEEEDDLSISIAENLDENGFPSLAFLSDTDELGQDEAIDVAAAKEEESFASDFYRSGADWSCLAETTTTKKRKSSSVSQGGSERKLKQTNLFQMWGVKKPEESTSEPRVSNSLKQTNLYQMWGVKKPNESNSKSRVLVEKKMKKGLVDSNVPNTGMEMNGRGSNSRRVCPFYKKIPGTSFTVDAFRYGFIEGCSSYFLSHFHYDHYGGLTKGWSNGPIYCTPLTARLVRMCISVNSSYIYPLEFDKEHTIEGVKVTMLEANHCPGAALIHFRLTDGRCYLHTGDFRASRLMQSYPLLANQRVNLLYLDTTYCNPKYKFPSKKEVLDFVVKITRSNLKKQPKTLIVVGAYSIGKECVYLAISNALGIKIYANASRRRILQSFGWPELSGKLCSNGHDTPLHVLPMSSLRHETLKQYLGTQSGQYLAVLAFRPTGWTYSDTVGDQLDLIRPNSKGNITIYGVPYSEHSSFLELQEFVQFLRPDKIIPTVNIGNATNRDKMQSCFRGWLKR